MIVLIIKPSVRNIELWPAKTDKTQQYRFMVKSPSHQAVSVKQAIWPKPKLLILLEEYLEKELRILQCPNKGPHELRLQVIKTCRILYACAGNIIIQ